MRKIIQGIKWACLLVFGLVLTVYGAQWQGFWGGQTPPSSQNYLRVFPGLAQYERGMWQIPPPVCFAFSNGPEHSWTSAELRVARAAINEWNTKSKAVAAVGLSGQLSESCPAPDVELRWGNNSFLPGFAGAYVPVKLAPPLGPDPCQELRSRLNRCSVVLANASKSDWFIDLTPDTDDEFEPTGVLCGTKKVLKAKRGGPAEGKQDFYTVILHEFGHALGLLHTGGCDGDPRTPAESSDDDGAAMWEGYLAGRHHEGRSVGLNERRHLTDIDDILFLLLYGGGRTPP